jgi:transposase InsO family protein
MNEWRRRFPLRWMAKILGVSTSGFSAWKKRLDSPREAERHRLLRTIEDIHRASRGSYGSPRIWEQLRGLGFSVSKARVERLMRENGIRAKTKKKFRVTTDSNHDHPVAKNTLNRDFSPAAPNQAWAGDITYVWTEEGWLYLAVIIDLYSRQVVGWAMNERITQDLTLSALRMALDRRNPGPGLLHHSDQGSQYAATAYRKLLSENGLICSMSRRGNCWDNAVVESFFHTLKTELLYHEHIVTRMQARRLIFEWIEVFYNRIRLHSTLGYKSPMQYEELKKAA